VTVFQLTRLRRIALIALYLRTRPAWSEGHPAVPGVIERYAGHMNREQLVAGILAAPEGQRLLRMREVLL
jgi:hypothetical protein